MRRYQDSDDDPTAGRRIVERQLRLLGSSAVNGLRYDLRFYGGGWGTSIAIAVPVVEVDLPAVLAAASAVPPEMIVADTSWSEHFLSLLGGEDEDERPGLRDAAARFLDEHREPFQPECHASSAIWFESQSGVNAWIALWDTDGLLGYLSWDQG